MVPEPRPRGHELVPGWIDAGELTIRVLHPGPRAVLVQVAGEIDLHTARRLDESLQSCVRGDLATVVLDLSDVTFFSVAGLNSLLRARLLTDTASARLVVDAERSRAVRRLLDLLPTDFDDVVRQRQPGR